MPARRGAQFAIRPTPAAGLAVTNQETPDDHATLTRSICRLETSLGESLPEVARAVACRVESAEDYGHRRASPGVLVRPNFSPTGPRHPPLIPASTPRVAQRPAAHSVARGFAGARRVSPYSRASPRGEECPARPEPPAQRLAGRSTSSPRRHRTSDLRGAAPPHAAGARAAAATTNTLAQTRWQCLRGVGRPGRPFAGSASPTRPSPLTIGGGPHHPSPAPVA